MTVRDALQLASPHPDWVCRAVRIRANGLPNRRQARGSVLVRLRERQSSHALGRLEPLFDRSRENSAAPRHARVMESILRPYGPPSLSAAHHHGAETMTMLTWATIRPRFRSDRDLHRPPSIAVHPSVPATDVGALGLRQGHPASLSTLVRPNMSHLSENCSSPPRRRRVLFPTRAPGPASPSLVTTYPMSPPHQRPALNFTKPADQNPGYQFKQRAQGPPDIRPPSPRRAGHGRRTVPALRPGHAQGARMRFGSDRKAVYNP